MTVSDVLFVRLRNSEGKYLGRRATSMAFFDDVNQAAIFDSHRDHIDEQIEQVRHTHGIKLEAVPVDPEEIDETCDRCGRSAYSFQMFFDGKQILCADCRGNGLAEGAGS